MRYQLCDKCYNLINSHNAHCTCGNSDLVTLSYEEVRFIGAKKGREKRAKLVLERRARMQKTGKWEAPLL